MRRPFLAIATAVLTLVATAPARAGDPAAALEQLKKGYELKTAGKCEEAIPHFVESHRLDPQAKTLLNLADCEERLGDLVSAQKHARDARQLAQDAGNTELLGIADERVSSIDKKMPRLTIRLAKDAPSDSVVSRDGTSLGAVSLGMALPINPGQHVVVVTAPGRSEKRFPVRLAEGAQTVIDVEPGPRLSGSTSDRATSPPGGADGRADTSGLGTRKLVALGLGGLGVVGVGVGSIFGLKAISGNSDSNANGHCDSTGCDTIGKQLRNDARSDATVSTVAFVVGLAALGGGAALWLTEPKPDAGRVGVSGYAVGRSGGSVVLIGRW